MTQQINLSEQAYLPTGSTLPLGGNISLTDPAATITLATAVAISTPSIDVSTNGVLFTPEIDIWKSGAADGSGSSKTATIFGESTGEVDFYSISNNFPLRIEFPGTIIDDTASFTNPNASALLDLTSTTRGLLPPRMTTTQKNAISSPAAGLVVFDTTLGLLQVWNGSAWVNTAPGQTYTAGTGLTLSSNQFSLTTPVSVANGGTGTSTPGLIAGTNISSITGTWPNQTINAANQTTNPAGSNTQVQFNNSGSFGASSDLSFNSSTHTLTLTSPNGSSSNLIVTGGGSSGGAPVITLKGATSSGAGNLLLTGSDDGTVSGSNLTLTSVPQGAFSLPGGSITLTSGGIFTNGTFNGASGGITITTAQVTGDNQTTGASGSITITTGGQTNLTGTNTISGAGGGITLTTGGASFGGTTTSGNGGSILLSSGIAAAGGHSGTGGSITLTSGNLMNGGSPGFVGNGGSITLTTGNNNGSGSVGALNGGSITLTTGSFGFNSGAHSSVGGSITLTSGNPNGGSDTGGNVTLTSFNAANGGNLILTGSGTGHGQVTVGGSTPNASASVDIQSTTRGALLPRMTTTQKNAITSPATGLLVYDTTLGYLQEYNGSTWTNVSPVSPPGGATTQLQYNNAGSFAGLATLTTDGSNVTLSNPGSSGGNFTMSSASGQPGGNLTLTSGSAGQTGGSIIMNSNNGGGGSGSTGGITMTANGLGNTGNIQMSAFQGTTGNIILKSGGAASAGQFGGNITLTSSITGPGNAGNIAGGITLTTGDSLGSGGNISLTASTAANGGSIILTGTGANGTSGAPGHGNIYANYLTVGNSAGGGVAYNDTGSNKLTLSAPTSITSSYSLKWPVAQGASGNVMINDGSGNLSWTPNGTGVITQNTYTVGTPLNTYTGSLTLFNLPFTYVQDGKSMQVFYNGQLLVSGVDYNETSNTSVTFNYSLVSGSTVQFRYITPSTPSNTSVAQFVNYVVGTASGTYTGSTTVYNLPFAYTQDGKSLVVLYDGVQLIPGDDYTETTSTSITTTQALTSGQKVAFRTISTIGNAAAVTALRENYVVGTASGNYTGSTTLFNLLNSYTPGGINLEVFVDGVLQVVGASNDYVETSTSSVTFNNALVSGQKVTFRFSQTVAATGTVTSATSGQMSYYASTGSTITGSAAITTDGTYVTSMALKTNTYTANHTINTSEVVILANANGGGFTVTLPDATTVTNKVFYIKKTDTSSNTVTVATTSSQTIDGVTTLALSTPYTVRTVLSDGSNWQIL